MSEVFHLIYASQATIEVTKDVLENILKVARENNSAKQVSGLLLYRLGHFVQLLEGAESEVKKIFEKIKKDSRHRNPIILAEFESQFRLFESWSMGQIQNEAENERLVKKLEFLLKTPLGFQDDMKSQVIDLFRQVNQKVS
jgi:hypothetical protein